jgi:hypothetical protein
MLKSGSIRFGLVCVLKLHFTIEFECINKTYCSNSWSGFWDGPTCASDKSLIAWAVSIQPQQEKEMIGMFVCKCNTSITLVLLLMKWKSIWMLFLYNDYGIIIIKWEKRPCSLESKPFKGTFWLDFLFLNCTYHVGNTSMLHEFLYKFSFKNKIEC